MSALLKHRLCVSVAVSAALTIHASAQDVNTPFSRPGVFKFANGGVYAFDSQAGKGLYFYTDSHGHVKSSLTIGDTTYRFSSFDLSKALDFDPCTVWAESGDLGPCPLNEDEIGEFKLNTFKQTIPSECVIVAGPYADTPPPPTDIGIGNWNSETSTYDFLIGSDDDGPIFYKQGSDGSPRQFGEEIVVSHNPLVLNAADGLEYDIFQIPDACKPVEENFVAHDTVSGDDLSSADGSGRCADQPRPLTYPVTKEELNDGDHVNNGIQWDNNPPAFGTGAGGKAANVAALAGVVVLAFAGANAVVPGLGFVVAPIIADVMSKYAADWTAVPTSRLWGTVWCGVGNEFAAYKRKIIDTNGSTGGGCRGETPINEQTSRPISLYDTYKSGSPKRNGRSDKKLFHDIKFALPSALMSKESTSDDLRTYHDWQIHELPTRNVWDSAGNPVQLAQRLQRCRSVPNYIDPDYQEYTAGLQVTGARYIGSRFGGTPYGDPNTLPYILKRSWDPVSKFTGYASEDWCRQHDWAPIAYSSYYSADGLCIADGRAWTISNDRWDYPWQHFGYLLFHNNMPAFPCKSIKLDCVGGRKWGVCQGWALAWQNSYLNKYVAGKEEGERFFGPIGRNDLGQVSVCATLRLPGEAVDGAENNPSIGDGICDCEYNNEWWGYDGGDCCEETCRVPVTNKKCSKVAGYTGSSSGPAYNCKQPGCFNGQTVNVGTAYNARNGEEGRTNQYWNPPPRNNKKECKGCPPMV